MNERKKKEKNKKKNGKVLNTTIFDYLIDSCHTFDCGYETAICKDNGCFVIVERYETYEDMQKGHEKWCELCEKEKPTELFSIQFEQLVEL